MTVSQGHVCTSTVVMALVFCTCAVVGTEQLVSKSVFLQLSNNGTDFDELLNYIIQEPSNHRCTSIDHRFHVVAVPLRTQRFDLIRQKADLVSRVVRDYGTHKAMHFIPSLLKNIVYSDIESICGSEMVFVQYNESGSSSSATANNNDNIGGYNNNVSPKYFVHFLATRIVNDSSSFVDQKKRISDDGETANRPSDPSHWMTNYYTGSRNSSLGNWTLPYYSCKYKRWVITYIVPLEEQNSSSVIGTFYVDIDVSHLDINQCDVEFSKVPGEEETDDEMDGSTTDGYVEIPLSQIVSFRGTHKCDRNTSKCIFTPGGGWSSGSYTCRCKDGYYSTTQNPVFNGTAVEIAWKDKTLRATYSLVYVCKQCAAGCDTCRDGSPCLSDYNWPFRISLLTISVICILLTILLMCYVYNYRKLKVIKVTSPVFLCVTLSGCVIMYMEMAAIFPVLDMYSCIATKWTRHLGFCITYSALLLKTWRVSLTYRVKSAHKIKLTDKQLLQWLFPILLVMVIYLSTWTVSSPPHGIYISDYNGLKLKQCTYDWWDHSLAIGEILFLLWGIRVCYTVRNAESFFNEAKHISYAIYSITLVNMVMVSIHLMILPTAPPDLKYLFGFVRTQFSTTVTILLVFGPKFYRVIKGQGDVYDNRARARGVTASFSLNGIGLVHEEPTDLYQENEELKEEIQKLAAQIEFMKIVHMEMNNRHIKPKVGGYFSQSAVNSTQSPVAKAIYMKFDSSDSPTSRISPAAELVSERV